MTFEEFKVEFKEKLAEVLKDGYKVCDRIVTLNNNKKVYALIVKPKKEEEFSICPQLYPYRFYEQFEDEDEITYDFIEGIAQSAVAGMDSIRYELELIKSFDNVKHLIRVDVVNTSLNRDLLHELVHFEYLDLSVVFKVTMDVENGCVSRAVISNSLLKAWGITVHELAEIARVNGLKDRDFKLIKIEDLINKLRERLEDAEIEQDLVESLEIMSQSSGMPQLYTIKNKDSWYGAGILAEPQFLIEICEQLNDDILIVPSSVHELIVLRFSEAKGMISEIKAMVKEVNSTINVEEILSYSVYAFKREKGCLEIVA